MVPVTCPGWTFVGGIDNLSPVLTLKSALVELHPAIRLIVSLNEMVSDRQPWLMPGSRAVALFTVVPSESASEMYLITYCFSLYPPYFFVSTLAQGVTHPVSLPHSLAVTLHFCLSCDHAGTGVWAGLSHPLTRPCGASKLLGPRQQCCR